MPPGEQRLGTLIKVCGIRSAAQAGRVLDLGADAVGVVTVPGSPRQVTEQEARSIAELVGAKAVLVVTGEHPGSPELRNWWPGPVQIHGPRSDPGRRYIHADPADAPCPDPAWAAPVARLVDAAKAGSGAAWKWTRPANLGDLPLLLAGGLDAANVGSAIDAVRPWAVDVSSGVERDRGVKDFALVAAFIAAVREADARTSHARPARPARFDDLA